MSRFLKADWFRIRHATPAFWLLAALCLAISLFVLSVTPSETPLEYASFGAAPLLVGCLSVLLCAAYDGTEIADGTFRPMLVSTGSRSCAYAASLLVEVACSLVLLLLFYAPYLLGLAAGHYIMPEDPCYMRNTMVSAALFVVITILICHLVSVFWRSQVPLLVTSAVILICLVIASGLIANALNEPETVSTWEVTGETENFWESDLTSEQLVEKPNPAYIPPEKRAPYETWLAALPATAMLEALPPGMEYAQCWSWWGAECVALCGVGLLAYRRRDLN